MNKMMKNKMALFGIGSEVCEGLVKTLPIGLGEPKTAFAIGFQQAVEFLYTTDVITLEQMEEFIERCETQDIKIN